MRPPSYRIVLQGLRLVGEAAWVFAWSAVLGYWLDRAVGPALPLWLLCGVLVVAAGLSRAVSPRTTVTWLPFAVSFLGVVVSVGAGLLATALAVGHLDFASLGSTTAGSWAFVAGCLALVAWWRGSRLGANRPSLYEVEGQFRFGVLAVAALLALTAILGAGAAPEPATLVEPALALVASGLLGVPLARIAEVSAGRRADSPRLEPGGPWLGTLLGVVGGLLLLTLLFAGIVSAERLGAVLGLVLGALGRVVWAIFMVFAVPAGYLVEWLVNLLKSRMTGQPVPPTLAQMPSIDQILKDSQTPGKMTPELKLLIDIVLAAGITLVVVILLARAITRTSWEREADGVEELRESVFGWDTIRELIAWVLGRLRRPQVIAPVPAADPDPVEPRSVREVYREFLRLTTRLGFPRARAETPLEYARRIERDRLSGQDGALPTDGSEARGDLDALTSTYVKVRYGPPAASPADVRPAARALERLRALWTRR